MDRVGGYLAYLALLEDDRAYDDVLMALEGEADASRVLKLEAEARARAAKSRSR